MDLINFPIIYDQKLQQTANLIKCFINRTCTVVMQVTETYTTALMKTLSSQLVNRLE